MTHSKTSPKEIHTGLFPLLYIVSEYKYVSAFAFKLFFHFLLETVMAPNYCNTTFLI